MKTQRQQEFEPLAQWTVLEQQRNIGGHNGGVDETKAAAFQTVQSTGYATLRQLQQLQAQQQQRQL